MRHIKAKHGETVPACRNEMNGYCHRGAQNCWFKHYNDKNEYTNKNINEEMNDEENKTNKKMIQKLVDMVENMLKES